MKYFLFCLIIPFFLASCAGKYPKEQLEKDVKASFIEQNDDPGIVVQEVNLVETDDNVYEG